MQSEKTRKRMPGQPSPSGPCLVIIAAIILFIATFTSATEPSTAPFRMAFSASMFSEVHENDARAAMKVWIMTVAKERDIPVDPNPNIFSSIDEMAKFGSNNSVDGFGITTPEYPRLSREIQFDRFAIGIRGGSISEEYVLLVYRNSGIEQLSQLKGRSLNVLHNPRMSLALIWLDTLLLEMGQNQSKDFLGSIKLNAKSSQVALPVFFGRDDACLMTRASFKVMGELNPQLNQQMRVLISSPAFVPSGFAFRSDHLSLSRSKILEAMTRLGESAAGRQILLLTKADRIEMWPISCLDSSLKLLARHQQLISRRN